MCHKLYLTFSVKLMSFGRRAFRGGSLHFYCNSVALKLIKNLPHIINMISLLLLDGIKKMERKAFEKFTRLISTLLKLAIPKLSKQLLFKNLRAMIMDSRNIKSSMN